MSIESEKKRLNDFLVEQTAAYEANKKRAREHCDSAVALADFRSRRSRITSRSKSR
jgi:hypothetical protein